MKKAALAIVTALIICTFSACSSGSVTVQGFAMDTNISVTLYGDKSVADKVLSEIDDIEKQISWSVQDSAVSILNEESECESLVLNEIVSKVEPLSDKTDGRYSLLLRPICELWNINGGNNQPPVEAEILLTLKECQGEIKLTEKGVEITGGKMDLGSVGKGYACDRAAQLLAAYDTAGIVMIGGSVALCGTKPSGDKWSVSVASAEDINKSVGTLYLEGGKFISTSGDSQRYFEYEGERYHHIIDGTTGYPAQSDLSSVTVICDSGLMSDALSTACFIVGYDKALTLLKRYGADAVFIKKSGEIATTLGVASSFKESK